MNEKFEEKKARVKELRPIDDVFFEVMVRDKTVCEEILRVIMEDHELTVKECTPQESYKNLYGRSVRLDAVCMLGNGTVCNIEVQKADNDNHEKRVRYNAAVLTTNNSDSGTKFESIPTVCVVYISQFDIFRCNRTVYHAEMTCRETGRTLDDGLTEIFVNTAVDDGSDIAELMQCFKKEMVENRKFPNVSRRVKELKETEGGVAEMCETMQRIVDEENLKLLYSLIAKNKISVASAAEEFGTSIPEFLAAAEAAGYELPKES